MAEMSEVAQQEAARVLQRVQQAMELLMGAHTAASRLVGLGGPDFTTKVGGSLRGVELLSGDITEAIGVVEPHRGLRTPPACSDPACPVHGESLFDAETRVRIYGGLTCAAGKKDPTDTGASTRTCPRHSGYGKPDAPCLCKFKAP